MLKLALVAVTLAFVATDTARAGPVRVDFSGVVRYFDPYQTADQEAMLGWSIPAGTPFSGYFTFDDSFGPSVTPQDEAVYVFPAPDAALHTDLGPLTTESGPLDPGYYGVNGDAYAISVAAPPGFESVVDAGGEVRGASTAGSVPRLWFTLELRRALANPLVSTELAGVPWSLADYAYVSAGWTFVFESGNELDVSGMVDRLTAVPEVSAAALLALAAAPLLARGFRRARS